MKKNIAVLFGGCSPEYPVSLKSAYAVLNHIDTTQYQVITVGITRDGKWLRYLGEYEAILNDTWYEHEGQCRKAFISPDREAHGLCEIDENGISTISLDAVFPVLHGRNGEDGSVQGLCQLAGIPVVGCDIMSSALCMDKHRAHLLAEAAGIKAPKAAYFYEKPSALELEAAVSALTYPLFVKPLRAGSSFGITKVEGPSQLSDAVELAFSFDNEIIIEENIDGFEVGCAVLGNSALTLGRVDEIELSGGFFDYTEKYTQETSTIYMPARIESATELRIQEAAAAVYRALGCKGFARVDLFLTPENEIIFNEVNTIPGFTAMSRYPNMLKGVGLSYTDIVQQLISMSLQM
ncbi:D-alanine--D-serine ligase VanG [Anaerovoracaceae bacterium 42-11]